MAKKIGFIVLGLLTLLIVGALIAPAFISGDIYKAQLKEKVEEITGRTLTIEGDLNIRLFPSAGVTAEKVTLSNPPGFADKTPFLTLSSLKVNVELMPLLAKKVIIKEFVLNDPVINLHATSKTANNWSFKKPQKPVSYPASPLKTPPVEEEAGIPGNIMLSNFKLENGTLNYTNDATGARMEFKKLDATMTVSSSASAVIIESSGEWNGKTISIKSGLGTLETFLKEQKADFNLDLKSELLAISASGNYKEGTVTGKGTIKSPSLKEAAAWLNPKVKLSTPAPLAFLSESDIRCGANYCNLSNIHLVLDKLEGKGLVKIHTGEDKPNITLDLKTGVLDLNPFLSPPAQASLIPDLLVSDAIAQQGQWSTDPIDLSGLKAFNASAIIKAEGILYRKITIGKTTLDAKLNNGRFTAVMPDAALYNGTGNISVTADSNATPPQFGFRSEFKSIQAEPLLKDAADMDRLTGTADMQLNTTARGNSQKEIISSLSGDGQMKLSDGTIKRVNLLEMLKNVQNAFATADNPSQVTNFSQMAGSFTISQGIATNRDLLMQLTGMNVSGEGNINLPANTINYRLTPKLVQTTQDQATGVATTREGLAVPVIIEGSLDNPKFRPDLAAATEALKDPKQFRENLKTSREALKDQIKNPKDAVKNLKGLLKGF